MILTTFISTRIPITYIPLMYINVELVQYENHKRWTMYRIKKIINAMTKLFMKKKQVA